MISFSLYSQENNELYQNINKLRKLSFDSSLDVNQRLKYSDTLIKLSRLTKSDSTILLSNRVLSYLYLNSGELDSFYIVNQENIKLAKRVNDTLRLAYTLENLAYYHRTNKETDSSYYYYFKARKHYKAINRIWNEASMLLNMANLQESERDFIGSEINAIEAIRILDNYPQKNHTLQWSLHNLVGVVSGQINRFDKAIEYHNKALENSLKIEDNYNLQLYTKTNIAILYRRKGEYKIAKQQFKDILSDPTIKHKEPSTYSSLLSGFAYTKFLNKDPDDVETESLFRKSLAIAKKIEDDAEVMSVSEYFSEYFLDRNNLDSALFYANQTYDLALKIDEKKSLLNALVLKAKIEKGNQAKKYLFEHIKLSDSLLSNERLIRNKFARIDYETDEIIKEKELISKQRLWLLVITYSLLVTLVSLYVIITQKQKNKVLEFAQKQQESNEEIYNLMLSQQDKVEEVKALEKRRISRELHDGVLGRLFGARLSLDSLNSDNSPEAINNRSNYINELKDIERDIRKVSHKLNVDFITNSSYFDIIKTLVESQTSAYNLDYLFEIKSEINWDILNNKAKIHVYRILQESLQNIYKHAYATQVKITIKQSNFLLYLTIKDNGIGFDINKTKNGIGLDNIKSRLQEINGKLNIESNKDEGTALTFEIKC